MEISSKVLGLDYVVICHCIGKQYIRIEFKTQQNLYYWFIKAGTGISSAELTGFKKSLVEVSQVCHTDLTVCALGAYYSDGFTAQIPV